MISLIGSLIFSMEDPLMLAAGGFEGEMPIPPTAGHYLASFNALNRA